MKIGIITFHFVSNHGAVLQSFATQRFLEKQGYQAEIIDYRPKYHTVRYLGHKNPIMYAMWYWKRYEQKGILRRIMLTTRSFFRCILFNVTQTDKKTACEFSRFITLHLHLSKRYESFQQLQKDPPLDDVYISGSDQLWNPDVLNHSFDPVYFLNFGRKGIPRIAYAVSIGKQYNNAELNQLHEYCKDLTAISLREYNTKAINAIGKDVHICIDPTLLLEANDYEELESANNTDQPYIFVYGFQSNNEILEAIELAKKHYQCHIINGSPHRINVPDAESVKDYGPDKFLALIKYARCVVTNSFHGTAFSIIYRKEFITVLHSTRGERMAQLLEKLNLKKRLWGDPGFSFDDSLDYDEVFTILSKLQNQSKEYLLSAISGIKGESIKHYSEEMLLNTTRSINITNNAFYGYFSDSEKCRASASGGAATAISEIIIEKNGIVFGVEYTPDYKSARYGMAQTIDELHRFCGSKYIFPELKCESGDLVYSLVKDKLLQGREVLFIGLGCIINGLYVYLSNTNVNCCKLYTIDLICHGPTLALAQEKFVSELEKRNKSSVVSFNTRYYKKEWKTPYILAKFANGKEYCKRLYETDFGFALKYYCRNSCSKCRFKGTNHISDITIGDYWGLSSNMIEYNKNGVSLLLPHSENGESLINMLLSSAYVIKQTDAVYAIKHNPMYTKSIAYNENKQTFEKHITQNGLHYAVMHSPKLKTYIKAAIKKRLLK